MAPGALSPDPISPTTSHSDSLGPPLSDLAPSDLAPLSDAGGDSHSDWTPSEHSTGDEESYDMLASQDLGPLERMRLSFPDPQAPAPEVVESSARAPDSLPQDFPEDAQDATYSFLLDATPPTPKSATPSIPTDAGTEALLSDAGEGSVDVSAIQTSKTPPLGKVDKDQAVAEWLQVLTGESQPKSDGNSGIASTAKQSIGGLRNAELLPQQTRNVGRASMNSGFGSTDLVSASDALDQERRRVSEGLTELQPSPVVGRMKGVSSLGDKSSNSVSLDDESYCYVVESTEELVTAPSGLQGNSAASLESLASVKSSVTVTCKAAKPGPASNVDVADIASSHKSSPRETRCVAEEAGKVDDTFVPASSDAEKPDAASQRTLRGRRFLHSHRSQFVSKLVRELIVYGGLVWLLYAGCTRIWSSKESASSPLATDSIKAATETACSCATGVHSATSAVAWPSTTARPPQERPASSIMDRAVATIDARNAMTVVSKRRTKLALSPVAHQWHHSSRRVIVRTSSGVRAGSRLEYGLSHYCPGAYKAIQEKHIPKRPVKKMLRHWLDQTQTRALAGAIKLQSRARTVSQQANSAIDELEWRARLEGARQRIKKAAQRQSQHVHAGLNRIGEVARRQLRQEVGSMRREVKRGLGRAKYATDKANQALQRLSSKGRRAVLRHLKRATQTACKMKEASLRERLLARLLGRERQSDQEHGKWRSWWSERLSRWHYKERKPAQGTPQGAAGPALYSYSSSPSAGWWCT